MLYTIVGMLVIILDQAVKFWVDKTINYTNPQIDLIPGVISLVRVQNDGAAFSFLAGGGARIWFIVLTLAFTVLVIIALATNFISGKFGRWCMVLVTAGGLANLIDRVLYGLVIDMFKVDLFDFAVFNVADIFITVFCIAFIIYILFGGEKEPEPDEDEFDEYDEEEEHRPKRERKKKVKEPLYVDDDYDYEEEKPARKAPKKAKPKKPAEDDYYEEVRAARKKSKSSVSKDVEDLFEDDRRTAAYRDEVRAERARQAKPARSEYVEPDDPFAEWERANAKARENSTTSDVAKAMNTTTGARPVARKAAPRPAQESAPARRPAPRQEQPSAPVRKPASEAPVKKPQPQPAPVQQTDDFDLDSIMNEFM